MLVQVLYEREGPVPDVPGDVLGAGAPGRQTTLQGLQDQARGIIQLLRIVNGLRYEKANL